ncbi:MAG: putative DNA-directed polymerase, omega subunit [Firmicutes bacterium]|nr:putative DNA-directed polymerase, omega subunit [Bacillota bacterium]
MRPSKLTITAFGPYAAQQIIDFTQLQGRNLFVITGDTGAGKTTILDAIAYALYGKASGRDRDGESLRSHFAAPDLITSVEMEFELSGQCYWVHRIPKQRKKRTRGEGYTDQNAEAEFKCLDGESSLISGVKEVNEKIVGLMGLSYDQFKQIIMIPQGEFRELLNADSKARQDILQKIFGTEGFRRVQELFDSQAKTLTQEISRLESQRNECIRSLDGSGYLDLARVLELPDFNISLVIEEAKQAIERDKFIASEMQSQVNEQEQRVAGKQGEIFQGKANNLKISIRDEAYQKKITLEACQPQFNENKLKLQLARKALGLIGVDEYRYSREVHVQKIKVELAEVALQEEKARTANHIGQNNYQLEIDKEGKRNELLTEEARLQGLTIKVADWDARQIKVASLEQDLAIVKKDRDTTKKQLEKTRDEIKDCQTSLDQNRAVTTEYAFKVVEQEKINSLCSKIEALKAENDHLIMVQQSVLILEQQEIVEQLKYKQTQADYEGAQNLFLEGQASLLASKLKTGDPCPVCGSDRHPHIAVMTGTILSEAELKELIQRDKQARELYDEVKGKYEHIKADYYAQHKIVSRLQKELGVIVSDNLPEVGSPELTKYIDAEIPKYQMIRQGLNGEIKKLLTQKKDEKELSDILTKNEQFVNKLAADLERLEVQYTEVFAKVESAKEAMKGLEAEVPPEVRSTKALAEALGRIKKEFEVMRQALETAEQERRDSQIRYATAMAEKRGIEKALTEGETELNIAQQNFMRALTTAGFGGEGEYVKAKLTEGGITFLENEINDFQERLRSASDYYLQVQQEVEGLMVIDIAALEAEYLGLQMEKNQLITQRTAIIARQAHNQTMLNSIYTLVERLEQKEEEHRLIGHLARIARGDNEQKISFERYVLAAFFNDIIDAANARLKKMTGGRYQMSRITQKGKGSGQSGLEIEVFDYYTGQTRHVKTLSGGESFKASLALALGLAEVVQSYAGGISLETMFVDEGFGTLDPESLDTAIGCLIELQHSGRLVGIISHVPELKNSIDARLEIEAYKDGSWARFCII